jgi:hypothetical protein
MGLVGTALAYMLYIEGVRRVRVEHASILGYLEPVSAPLYALLLLGEAPSATTLVGGGLIVAAGFLVVRYGAPEPAPGHAPDPSPRPGPDGAAARDSGTDERGATEGAARPDAAEEAGRPAAPEKPTVPAGRR